MAETKRQGSLPLSCSRSHHFHAMATISATNSAFLPGHFSLRKWTRPCASIRGTMAMNRACCTASGTGTRGCEVMGNGLRTDHPPLRGDGRVWENTAAPATREGEQNFE